MTDGHARQWGAVCGQQGGARGTRGSRQERTGGAARGTAGVADAFSDKPGSDGMSLKIAVAAVAN